MSQAEYAVARFKEGFSCSQAVLAAYGPALGMEHEMALRVAGAFGGGMGRLGDTCGAVTGAFMVIGLKYGKTRAEDDEMKEKAYALVQEFAAAFKTRHGSLMCRALLGCDLSTPEGRAHASQSGLSSTLCPQLVQDAAEILAQILE